MASHLRQYRAACGPIIVEGRLRTEAATYGLRYFSPLLDLEFLGGLTASIPERDFIARKFVVSKHFADLLPAEIMHRTTKARFNSAVFNTSTHRFAESWDGHSGVPLDLVEPEALRNAWLETHDARSGLLLQSAWLATQGIT